MIPNGTRVWVKNTFGDVALKHVDGLEGDVVCSYFLNPTLSPDSRRRYIVTVQGLDYDLSAEELEVV
jgi:hypothetical protein